MSSHLRTWYKAPNPALNIPRHHEDLLSDCIYSDVPAIDGGEPCAQVFFGRRTHVGDAYKMKSESEFPNTLQRNICECGAPDCLLTNSATHKTSNMLMSSSTTFTSELGKANPISNAKTHVNANHGKMLNAFPMTS
jgi:hypothetical protein